MQKPRRQRRNSGPAVRRLSNWIRESLGDDMANVARSNRELAKATTPSLKALDLLTQAEAAAKQFSWALASQLSREALAEDPGFASAHLQLALSLSGYRGVTGEEARQELRRAMELAASASEREQLLIEGCYQLMQSQTERAIATLEKLAQSYPDGFSALAMLSDAYYGAGRRKDAENIRARIADLRPNDFRTNVNVAMEMTQLNYARAVQYARRAFSLAASDASRIEGRFVDQEVLLIPFFDAWTRDTPGALRELDTLATTFSNQTDFWLATRIGECYLAMGRVRAARDWFQRTMPARNLPEALAYTAYAIRDENGARAQLELLKDEPKWDDVWFLIPRLRSDSERFLPRVAATLGKNGPAHFPGELALSQNRLTEAKELLLNTFTRFPTLRTGQIGAESLVVALERSGEEREALSVLEESGRRKRTLTPVFWMRNRARLAQYYYRLNRDMEARSVEAELRRMLAAADSDYWMMKQLGIAPRARGLP